MDTKARVIQQDELKDICTALDLPTMISHEGATIKVHVKDVLDYLPAGYEPAPTRMVMARGDNSLCFSYYVQRSGKNGTPKFAFRFGTTLMDKLNWSVGETRVNCFFDKKDPTRFFMIPHETGNKVTSENKHENAGKMVMNAFFNFNKPLRRTSIDYKIVKLGNTDAIQCSVNI